MKKTLIALLSILLIAFAFTACDNGNKGPEIRVFTKMCGIYMYKHLS